ncbi:DUF167 domain-containing protein [Actinokineospora diospyrosa]|uniref:UPF0235 protein LV75_005444 n=1 Tax=Actinokineospora diospyrosa TaxID=103728 RepID=A0ABT1IJT9_9PSEU|nr:DUF167 domain-containing protein [Actinokineospora diospyrosa]MCP2272918.1 hypothetical protein [Actinokineospora diospyrosa]
MSAFRFGVRVKPGARRESVGGRWGDAGALVVAVRAGAVEGKANDAVLRALAAAFGVPRRDVVIVAGAWGRDKVVAIDPVPPAAADVLERLLGAAS